MNSSIRVALLSKNNREGLFNEKDKCRLVGEVYLDSLKVTSEKKSL